MSKLSKPLKMKFHIKTEKPDYEETAEEIYSSPVVKMELTEVHVAVKSCVMSQKGGVPLGELNRDYQELVGEPIPTKKLGFESLVDFLKSIPGVTIVNSMVHATSEKTKHLEALISKQKDPSKNKLKKFNKNRYTPYPPLQTQYYDNYYPTKPQNFSKPPYPKYENSKYGPPKHGHPKYGHAKYGHAKWGYNYNNNNNYYVNRNNNYGKQYYAEDYKVYPDYDYDQRPTCPHKCFNCHCFSHSYNNNCNYQLIDLNQQLNGYFEAFNNVLKPYFDDVVSNGEYWFEQASETTERCHLHNTQVIGDELILDLIPAKDRLSNYQLCEPGLTAKRALLGVRQHGCSDRVLVAIGSADILMGMNGRQLILDMSQLAQTLQNSGAKVKMCTVPPMLGLRHPEIEAINMYNRWLKYGDHNLKVVDLNGLFKDGPTLKYELFEKMKKTNGCISMTPWTRPARDMVQKELEIQLH